MINKKIGIIIRGGITNYTADIVNEYQKNFHDAEIIVSTWKGHKTDNIPCKVVTSIEPEMPQPNAISINHQVISAKAGLAKISSDIVLMCRGDQIIHNQKIFEIYEKYCPKTKIMVSSSPRFVQGIPEDYSYEYFIPDFCQISTNQLMHEFWDDVPYFDGSSRMSIEKWFTKNYVRNIKKDSKKWHEIKNEYFYIRDWYDDFRIEWKSHNESEVYRTRQCEIIEKNAIMKSMK